MATRDLPAPRSAAAMAASCSRRGTSGSVSPDATTNVAQPSAAAALAESSAACMNSSSRLASTIGIDVPTRPPCSRCSKALFSWPRSRSAPAGCSGSATASS